MTMNGFKIGLGDLKVPLTKRHYFTVTGGPYYDRPTSMVGVKMAQEIHLPCDVDIPTRDFSVPTPATLAYGLAEAVEQMLRGEPLYVGCMGGRGRTGLFLAVLAKAMGVKQPVEFVRKHYYPHAVETADQYRFVQEFEIPLDVKAAVKQARLNAQWYFWTKKFWFANLTRKPGRAHTPRQPRVVRLDK
jgi:hypothetical protein